MLTTLRRLSWTELLKGAAKSERQTKKLLAHMTEFLSRAG
jgi:hypothetical protein